MSLSFELAKKIENFSKLSDQECALLIRDNFLEALESDTYIDWDIVAKFIMTPYTDREALCRLLNSAVKKNIQKLGNFTVEEWIRKYQDHYADQERTPNTFFEYTSTDPEVKRLSHFDQLLVARILRIYDYLLIIPIIDLEGPVSNILRFAMRPNDEEKSTRVFTNTDAQRSDLYQPIDATTHKTIQILLSEGLHKFDKLGEQLLTSQPLKLQYSSSPVRPSIKNWLADYHQIYGQGAHSEMNRGSYLFNSENTKRLSNTERQRLAIILKSLDLDLPIDIDTNAQQIVFNTQITAISNKNENQDIQKTSIVSTNDRNQSMESSQEPLRTHLEKIEESDLSLHQYPLSANKISFSSPQKLSYERTNKEQTQPQKFIPAVNRPQISTNMPIKKTFGKNVVNLKELQ